MKNSQKSQPCNWLAASLGRGTLLIAVSVVVSLLLGVMDPGVAAAKNAKPTRSTTIALTPNERNVVVVNRLANSVSIIQVKDKNGNIVSNKLAEITVGEEPRCVAVQPSNRAAYVTNAISGIVSVIDLRNLCKSPLANDRVMINRRDGVVRVGWIDEADDIGAGGV